VRIATPATDTHEIRGADIIRFCILLSVRSITIAQHLCFLYEQSESWRLFLVFNSDSIP